MQGPWLILLSLLVACATKQPNEAGPSEPSATATVHAEEPAVADAQTSAKPSPEEAIKTTINDRFLDPKLDVDRWKKNFEGESREVYAARKEVIAALDILPGQSVADIGAGTGFYLWQFAQKVGAGGRVYGVDISPRFLERMRKDAVTKNITNATIVTGSERSVELPKDSVDLVFICDTYHHFEYPQTTLTSIRRALRPGGALVIIDFHRIVGESSAWTLDHVRGGQKEFRKEIEAAGFTFEKQLAISGFKDNYMIRFRAGE